MKKNEKEEQEIVAEKDVEYFLCTCGHSSTIPFCDDTHEKINEEQGTDYHSLHIKAANTTKLSVCSKNWKR